MEAVKRLFGRFVVIQDLLKFFWERKLWWLIPMLLVLALMGLLIAFAQSSSVAPFVYVLF